MAAPTTTPSPARRVWTGWPVRAATTARRRCGGDALAGGPGDDRETGGVGRDRFDQGPAADGGDRLDGGPGTDVVDYRGRSTGSP